MILSIDGQPYRPLAAVLLGEIELLCVGFG